MQSQRASNSALEDISINVKLKLSALWTATMFIYAYVDILGFYKPGTVENILVGKVWQLEISQTWAASALVLMAIPSLMIGLSLLLKPKANRRVNIAVACFYILVSISNPIGESWAFIWIGAMLEILLLAAIVWNAWFWPRCQAAS